MDEIRDILKELATDLVLMKETQKDAALKSQQEWQEIAARFRETDEKFKETDEKFKETSRELNQSFKETNLFVKEVSKKLGELGNKLGSFTEGMAYPSLVRILQQHFGATHVFPQATAKLNGENLEIDVLGYSNGHRNTAVVVEVKAHLRKEDIEQILRILKDFPRFYPDHQNKTLYGMLIGVNTSESVRNLAIKQGLYVGRISEETFELRVPDDFRARNFCQV